MNICSTKYDKWENSLYRNFHCYELIIHKNLKSPVTITINVCIYTIFVSYRKSIFKTKTSIKFFQYKMLDVTLFELMKNTHAKYNRYKNKNTTA